MRKGLPIDLSLMFSRIFLVCFLFAGCRKPDFRSTVSTPRNSEVVNSFLKLPSDADPILIRLASALRKKDSANPFIERMIVASGKPQWGFSEINFISAYPKTDTKSVGTMAIHSLSQSTSTNSDTAFMIPFIYDGDKRVNSFIAVRLSDSVQLALYQAKDFSKYGYDHLDNKPTAKSVAMRCMLFEHRIYKRNFYKIIDKDLALSFSGGQDTIGFFQYDTKDTLPATVQPSLVLIGVDVCVGGVWTPDPNAPYNTYTTDHMPIKNVGGDCDTRWYYFDSPDGDPLPSFGSDPGSTSGGGGDDYNASNYDDANRHPGPWESTDPNGYYDSRKAALEDILADDPFAISPCPPLAMMPLDDLGGNQYGLSFKRVAQVTVSADIKQRLSDVANQAPKDFFNTFKVQSLDDAFGPVVNCDFFAVNISSLPSTMTPGSLLESFRKYTNNFISQSVNVSFEPYSDASPLQGATFTDAPRFYSDFQASLGAIVHIHMINDGSVVESDYSISSNPFYCRFVYTTITSPLDGSHPVSGNREFGIFANPGNTGYTFYTLGVDRTTTNVFDNLNYLGGGFDKADQLWSSVQTKMAKFIEDNGGHAQVRTPVTSRVYWDQVSDYLKGKITFAGLKARLGC